MTAPVLAPPRRQEWWTRPAAVLPLILTVMLCVALLAPQQSVGRFGDARLSAHLSGGLGARALLETAQRFGFTTRLRDGPLVTLLASGTTIHAVLAPPMPISPEEAHVLLQAVRGGDALLLALDDRNALADSLGVRHTGAGGILRTEQADSAGCRRQRDLTPPLWPDGRAHLFGVQWVRRKPASLIEFASIAGTTLGDVTAPSAVGFTLGRGRVVVVADPDLLRNDVLRRCEWGADAIALRMLEWLRAGGPAARATLVFDEYHQGFGPTPSIVRVTTRFLRGHPAGRAILVLAAAGLVLLWGLAPRALPPVDVERMERRNPLEQIDALAHAYEQVGASRTAVSRLLGGMRWRVEGPIAAARRRDDDAFLDAVLAADSTLGDEVSLVRRALRTPISGHDLATAGAALRHIEDSLTTTRA